MGSAQREYYSAVGANTFGHIKNLLDVDVKQLENVRASVQTPLRIQSVGKERAE
jgi:hypothetical protein